MPKSKSTYCGIEKAVLWKKPSVDKQDFRDDILKEIVLATTSNSDNSIIQLPTMIEQSSQNENSSSFQLKTPVKQSTTKNGLHFTVMQSVQSTPDNIIKKPSVMRTQSNQLKSTPQTTTSKNLRQQSMQLTPLSSTSGNLQNLVYKQIFPRNPNLEVQTATPSDSLVDKPAVKKPSVMRIQSNQLKSTQHPSTSKNLSKQYMQLSPLSSTSENLQNLDFKQIFPKNKNLAVQTAIPSDSLVVMRNKSIQPLPSTSKNVEIVVSNVWYANSKSSDHLSTSQHNNIIETPPLRQQSLKSTNLDHPSSFKSKTRVLSQQLIRNSPTIQLTTPIQHVIDGKINPTVTSPVQSTSKNLIKTPTVMRQQSSTPESSKSKNLDYPSSAKSKTQVLSQQSIRNSPKLSSEDTNPQTPTIDLVNGKYFFFFFLCMDLI